MNKVSAPVKSLANTICKQLFLRVPHADFFRQKYNERNINTMAKKVATKTKKCSAKKPCAKKNEKYTYLFGKTTDGDAKMRNLLGGKGANLAEMARIGLPVPPGFTITTEVCTYFYDNGKKYPASLEKQVKLGVESVEKQMGKKFGDEKDPLLFSVRSGARESMPGMMDTILNLGLIDLLEFKILEWIN